MSIQFRCNWLHFDKTDELDWDYGFTVKHYYAQTPLGEYMYFQVPAEYPAEENTERETAGMYSCFGPGFDENGENIFIGLAENWIKAQQLCRRDIETRVLECLNKSTD